MKTPFLNRKSKGFTLIELLVVIAIILTLAGIAMTVVNGVMEKSKVTTARSDCNGRNYSSGQAENNRRRLFQSLFPERQQTE